MLCPRRQGKFDEGEERRGKEMKREERQKGGKFYLLINALSKKARKV